MTITYRCKCGHEFDGHWHRTPSYTDWVQAMTCPKCGDMSYKKNIDSDEDPTPERTGTEPAGVDEEDMTP